MARKTEQKNVDELLFRIVNTLDLGSLPTVQDAADLELLARRYWENEDSLEALGLVKRVSQRSKSGRIDRDGVLVVINSLIQRKEIRDREGFVAHVRSYLAREITASDLLGQRYRKPRSGKSWQHYEELGEKAERLHLSLISHELKIHTGNHSINERLKKNLYELLSILSGKGADTGVVRKEFNIPEEVDLYVTHDSYISAVEWRNAHNQFKKIIDERKECLIQTGKRLRKN